MTFYLSDVNFVAELDRTNFKIRLNQGIIKLFMNLNEIN